MLIDHFEAYPTPHVFAVRLLSADFMSSDHDITLYASSHLQSILLVWQEIFFNITSDLEGLQPIYCSRHHKHCISYICVYMYVWQISIAEWIIFACHAQTMKACLQVNDVCIINRSVFISEQKWLLCRLALDLLHTCTKSIQFAWMNEKFLSVVNIKLIVQTCGLNVLRKNFLIWELNQSYWEQLQMSHPVCDILSVLCSVIPFK